ncbi:MAG: hypothetical protein JNL83_38845 [Myxococcales bacterium]|nr:hypothetical protein [Myxococcales bacterium]
MVRLSRFLVLAALAAGSTAACAHEPKSVLVKRPDDKTADAAITKLWASEIRKVARDGDWILTRSYYAVSDGIVVFTPGEDLSHASMFDAKRDTIIESIESGVREMPLEQLVGRNHYVIVVRPTGMTAADQSEALARARSVLGAPYDIGGMFGFETPGKYYCSELVFWASQTEARSGRHETVVTPSDLMKYGEVIYWSGKRDDRQVMELATSRAPRTTKTETAAKP